MLRMSHLGIMSGYYLQLAWQNLRCSPWLTALIVLAIAVGIGSSMTVYSLLHAMSRDPIPQKSARLYAPWLDSRGAGSFYEQHKLRRDDAQHTLTWRDAMALWRSGLAHRQAVMYAARYTVAADTPGAQPLVVAALATHRDLFDMFDLQFRGRGGAWSAGEDTGRAQVVVLTTTLAARLYPGDNPVGRIVRIDGHGYRVVGVVDDWSPNPRFHVPVATNAYRFPQELGEAEALFVPIEAAAAQLGGERPSAASWSCASKKTISLPRTPEGYKNSDCAWVQFWVELENRAQVRRYEDHLAAYAQEQEQAHGGPYSWSVQWRLFRLPEWLFVLRLVPDIFRLAGFAGFGFLLVCFINAAGLMLARFHARTGELQLRRALGASRAALFAQSLTESALLGVAAALLGVLLLLAGIAFQRWILLPGLANVLQPDATLVAAAVLLAIAGTLCAGLYPAWVAARRLSLRHPPARHAGHRFGAMLMVVQIALTLGIVANALNVAWQSVAAMRQPVGIDEQNIFLLSSSWAGRSNEVPASIPEERDRKLKAWIDADLAVLRALPGVVDAMATNGLPFRKLVGAPVGEKTPAGAIRAVPAVLYFSEGDAVKTLGLKLIEGEGFRPEHLGSDCCTVITRDLAQAAFPDGRAMGKVLHVDGDINPRGWKVVGIADTLRASGYSRPGAGRGMLFVKYYFLRNETDYVVRAHPGQLRAVMPEARRRLMALDPDRMLSEAQGFAELRASVQRTDSGLVVTLLAVCALLVAVIALGIVGLAYYWTAQRQLQISIRRALGARRGDILRRVLAENLLVVAIGASLGAGLAVAGNLWLMQQDWQDAMLRIPAAVVCGGGGLIVLLSQFAVLWPALRASLIAPAAVTRNA